MLGRSKKTAASNSEKIDNALRAIKNKEGNPVSRDYSIYTTDEGKQVSTKSRIVKAVQPPETRIPSDEELFDKSGLPNHELIRAHFLKEGKLAESQLIRIIDMARSLFTSEPNMLTVPAPVTVCGDVHGQYYDLMKLFEVGGHPSKTSYLFLGDYVDRGSFSVECLVYLYSLKLNFPTTFWMLRGNHECRHLTEYFTFKNECAHKYSLKLYEASIRSFNALPLAAIMSSQFFCVHGGISPSLKNLEDINALNRFREPPTSGLMCDLLWADPVESYDDDDMDALFVKNTLRGCSYAFTYKASCQFLNKTGLLCIIRAHEAQDAGYRMYKRTKSMGFPSLLTMFSAPNYLDNYNNKAAVLKYENNVMNIRQFNSSPHPYWLPNFIDVFTWSLPFVGEKVVDMLVSILNICTQKELEEETPLANPVAKSLSEVGPQSVKDVAQLADVKEESPEPNSIEAKRTALRNKIIAIGRVSRMYQILRSESDKVEQLRSFNGGHLLPKGALLSENSLENQLSTFEKARMADLANEAMPPSQDELKRRDTLRKQKLKEKIKREVDKDPSFQGAASRLSSDL